MPTPDRLIEIASRHAVHLERLKSGYVKDADAFLRAMERDLLRQLRGIDDPSSLRGRRLQGVLRAVRETLGEGFENYERVWRRNLRELAEYESDFERRALREVVDYDFSLPSPDQIFNAAFSQPLSVSGIDEGKLLEPFYRDWTGRTYDRVQGSIRLGAAQGQTTEEIVRRIRGTRARRFRDGILDATRRDVTLMTRTALQHVAVTAKAQVWQDNNDIISEMEFLAVLDARTSVLCRSLSGRRFPLGQGPQPPLHIGCRSNLVPVFDGDLDLLNQGGTKVSRDADGNVKRVDADLTYFEWLKTQPADFQDSVIGETRGALLRRGGLSAGRFAELQLDKNFRPVNLDQMRELEPTAFQRAGI